MSSCPNAPFQSKLRRSYCLEKIHILDLDNLRLLPRGAIKEEAIEEDTYETIDELMEEVEERNSEDSDSETEDTVENEIAIANGDRSDLNFFDWEKIVNYYNIRKRFTEITPNDVVRMNNRDFLIALKDFAIPYSNPITLDEHLFLAFMHSACMYRLDQLSKKK